MTTTTEFQLVDINKLVPYANNARTHNKEQILKLRSSLREFGFVNPVIIDKEIQRSCWAWTHHGSKGRRNYRNSLCIC